jgi:hypothetical protein
MKIVALPDIDYVSVSRDGQQHFVFRRMIQDDADVDGGAFRSHQQHRVSATGSSAVQKRAGDAGLRKRGKLLIREWVLGRFAHNYAWKASQGDAVRAPHQLIACGAYWLDVKPLGTRKRMEVSGVCCCVAGAMPICMHPCNQLGKYFARFARALLARFPSHLAASS